MARCCRTRSADVVVEVEAPSASDVTAVATPLPHIGVGVGVGVGVGNIITATNEPSTVNILTSIGLLLHLSQVRSEALRSPRLAPPSPHLATLRPRPTLAVPIVSAPPTQPTSIPTPARARGVEPCRRSGRLRAVLGRVVSLAAHRIRSPHAWRGTKFKDLIAVDAVSRGLDARPSRRASRGGPCSTTHHHRPSL